VGFAHRRGMKKAFAALGGAAAAVLIVLFGVFALYHPPSHDNWDMGTPMLTLAALLPAALFGAVIGFLLVDLVQARQRKAAGWVGGGGALLVVMIPVGIVLFPYIVRFLPSRPPSPSEMRAEWARRLGRAPSDLGARLADDLQRCIGDQSVPPSGEALLAMVCDAAPRRSLALGPDKLMKLGSYSDADDGWRWELRDSAGHRRLMVLPDPLLAQPGPTFEVRSRETVRNDPPPRPKPQRFNRDSTLLRLAHFRECVRTRAAGFRQAGTWSGLGESLPPLLETREPEPAGCPVVGIYDAAEGPLRPWFLQVRDGDAYPLRVEYRAVFDGSVDTPFELSVVTAGAGHLVGYMIDRRGEWHARAGERPFADDLPPDPCMLDLSVPCQ
jgi:hypothetical protein